jgi:hypothetical protein
MSIDNSIYAVIHSASDYIPYEQLQHKFVSIFVLGDVMTCLYIVKIDSIRGLSNLFKNYGAHGEDVNGPEGRSLYCLNLNCRAPPGRFLQPDLSFR